MHEWRRSALQGKGCRTRRRVGIHSDEPSKLDQSRFLRMQFQSELYRAVLKRFQESLGFYSVFETHHQIISVWDDDHIARGRFLAPSLDPKIENIIQAYSASNGETAALSRQTLVTRANYCDAERLLGCAGRSPGPGEAPLEGSSARDKLLGSLASPARVVCACWSTAPTAATRQE
jgi:hypothetical protein